MITQKAAGGTALEDRSFPILPVAGVVVVVGGLIAFFALRDGGDKPVAPSQPVTPEPTAIAGGVQGAGATQASPEPIAIVPTGPSADTVAGELVKDLNRQRLWSEANVIGTRLDVSSGACEEPAMAPAIDGMKLRLRATGLTQVRCLDKSGRPVFARDL